MKNHPEIYREKFGGGQIGGPSDEDREQGQENTTTLTQKIVSKIKHHTKMFKNLFKTRSTYRRSILLLLLLLWQLNSVKYGFMAITQLILQNKPFCLNNFQLGNLEILGQSSNILSYLVSIIWVGLWRYHYLNLIFLILGYGAMTVAIANITATEAFTGYLVYLSTILTSLFTILPATMRTLIGKILPNNEYGPTLSLFCLLETIFVNFVMYFLFNFYEKNVHLPGGEKTGEIIFGGIGVTSVLVMLGISVVMQVLFGKI